jgi:1,4-alpha-glucan branching enzyme
MRREVADDGCLCFRVTVSLDEGELGRWFQWGVSFGCPDGSEIWAIPTEVKDRFSRDRHRSFQLCGPDQEEQYYLTHCRRLGANKCLKTDGTTGIRFAVWAPNARNVEVVLGTIWDRNDPRRTPAVASLPFSDIAGGYIANDGTGMNLDDGPFRMRLTGDGVWETDTTDSALADFRTFDHKPYMFRVTKDDGSIAYRTDLYSRCQIGYGSFNPGGAHFGGLLSALDGSASCSVVIDPDRVTRYFKEEPPYLVTTPQPTRVWPERYFIDEAEFWKIESAYRDNRSYIFQEDAELWKGDLEYQNIPRHVEDLIIYELHIGALGFGNPGPGTLEDAIRLLDHLVSVGVNAIELLPMSEFGGGAENWGYATSHYFAIEYGGGGRDQYKFFIDEAHRRGLAVIMDVVYNHFSHEAERAEYQYDSNLPDCNIYYWYEGEPSNYSEPDGGYVDNMSTAFAPRYHEEMVRKMFISSAVALVREFHVDGFRLDQTTSIHSYNRLHSDRREVSDANIFGAKLLREFSRTLRMLKPDILLMAEDHSEWEEVTAPLEAGGLGFDARWYADFYHHLAGDTQKGTDYAKLLYTASRGDNEPLAMDYFAGALQASASKRVVYNESHDEAGNSGGPFQDPEWDRTNKDKEYTSHRNIVVSVNGAPLVDNTRRYAEARCRFAYGMTVLSAGTPMSLFGEEVGAVRRFKYNAVLQNKEDLLGLGQTSGAALFAFYRAVNGLRRNCSGLRSRNVHVVYLHNSNRVLAFTRWDNQDTFLVIASLNDHPFERGYTIHADRLPNGAWMEIFNSDSSDFGGDNVGNYGGRRDSHGGQFDCNIPFSGFLVFRRLA